MLKILIMDKIDHSVVEELKKRGHSVQLSTNDSETIYQEIQKNEIMIVRSATRVTKRILDAAAKTGILKIIIRAGVGVDNIEVDYAREMGIRVLNTPLASSTSVAELALAHMFTLARNMIPANLTLRQGRWNKNECLGVELSGKILGIIGMGRIGQILAQKASALGMKIIYCDIATPLGVCDSWQRLPLADVLRCADFISLHTSSQEGDRYLIDEEQFRLMKGSSFLINTARGKLINEEALLNALEKGVIAGAGIDVYGEEPCHNNALLQNERVSVTPHIGASTREAQTRIGEEIIRMIEEYQDRKNLKNKVGEYGCN
ncbi:MAG TPA: NAD(P)-dependent oxidoreductase [Atribacterota bacterium]|nr:NAD(P)-dependent oxidoreductase [Atribacterota bacterium]